MVVVVVVGGDGGVSCRRETEDILKIPISIQGLSRASWE